MYIQIVSQIGAHESSLLIINEVISMYMYYPK